MIAVIVLGLIQGLTEFFPISSSGHLVILQHLLKLNPPGLILEVLLHLATILAVAIHFKEKISYIVTTNQNWIRYIIVSTLITGLLGWVFKPIIMSIFNNINIVFALYLFVGILIFSTKSTFDGRLAITWKIAILFGILQAAALLPGISRSGITISVLLLMGVFRREAFEYSFIASIPITLIASIHEIITMNAVEVFNPIWGIAMLVAFISGMACLKLLDKIISSGMFYQFSYYCWFVAIGGFLAISLP